MPNKKYQRLPHAGDFEKENGMEIVYLSPKPIPTGLPAISSRQLHRNANATFMDYSTGQGNFEFMARIGIGSIMLIVTTLLLFSAFASWIRRHSEPFLSAWASFFFNPVIWLIILSIAALYLYYFTKLANEISSIPPLRFNRERREVVYVAKKGKKPSYIPWESVIACVSTGKLITQYAVTPEHKLMIGLRDSSNGEILWNVIPCGSSSLAISEWETIRAYMEHGITALPINHNNELEEGTVEFFHLCRQNYREEHSLIGYIWGFLTIQFFSGWTLPCYISGWINNRPKAIFQRDVLEWSKPIPAANHIKPSTELIAESKEIHEYFARGQTIFDYFSAKSSEEKVTEAKVTDSIYKK
ncbi:hypothetical protein M5G22_15055 [Pseudomonas sp. TNT2022 ID233]|uniref:hypothetical protein n=1 Tax=Pseudomonas aphyarum TaxID=2942629 RepID=UPI0023606740|nr:hypothetical protein [Pseudomonas aphyarum]MDD1138872.1 hypothetical protein [Pseudomonas aphyarum]